MLEGLHVGYGDILTAVLIIDNSHYLVIVSVVQEGDVLTETQVSHTA